MNKNDFISKLFKEDRISLDEFLDFHRQEIIEKYNKEKEEIVTIKDNLNPFSRPKSCEFISVQTTDKKGKHTNTIKSYCPDNPIGTTSSEGMEDIESNEMYPELLEVTYQHAKKTLQANLV